MTPSASQPNATPSPPPALGIDLGTTMSVAAAVDPAGHLTTLRNDQDSRLTPSAVYVGDDIYVGAEALRMDQENPGNLIEAFKRDMGEPHYHERIRDYWVPPEVFGALVIQKLADNARRQLGDLGKVAITAPAYFDERRRQSTLSAGRLAGLDVAGIINEPTAAALAHYYSTRLSATDGGEGPGPAASDPQRIMVYDLGGGTFDVSILESCGHEFRTLATDGDAVLGGRDFDEQLVHYIADAFAEKFGVDPRSEPKSSRRIWQIAQETKHALSKENRAVAVCRFADMRHGIEVTRETFEALIAHFLQRTVTTCQEVLHQAGLEWCDLTDFLLVGGSTRIPAVTRCLQVVSRRRPRLVDSPDEAVAHGAAIYAAAQHSDFLSDLQIVNVNSHSLGIAGIDVATQRPVNKIIIRRNTPLPATSEQRFVTREAGQENVSVQLLEGESENPRYCSKVARCLVELDPNLPAHTEVIVTTRYDADGTISASAIVPRTRQSALVELVRSQIAELDPLHVWRERLLRGEEPDLSAAGDAAPEPASLAAPEDAPVEAVIERADYLCTMLGEAHLSVTAPINAVACQRAVQEIGQEAELVRRLLGTLEVKLLKSSHRQVRARLQEDLATLRTYLRNAERYQRHLLLALGRECSSGGVAQDESRALLDELQSLHKALAVA